jgi:[ribosomal protein S5]-alanine N-acetyltransferase
VNAQAHLPELQTARLRLRAFVPSDAAFMVRLLNEPSFISGIADRCVRNVEEAEQYLALGPLASYEKFGHGLMLVLLASSGESIGMCGVLKRDNLDLPDLGYAISEVHAGLGFASEAVQAVLRDARERLQMPALCAIVKSTNVRSIRVLENAGFEYARMEAFRADEPPVKLYQLAFANM